MRRFNYFTLMISFMLIFTVVLPWTVMAATDSQASIEQTFQNAKKDYLEKKMDAAAQQIHKSAEYMKAQADKASGKGKEALNASAKELEKLAVDMRTGTVTSAKKMEDTFARAYAALALDSHIQSTESWAKKEKIKAGDALDSANKYLEHGFAWAGQKMEKGTSEAINKSRELSLKLKKKGGVAAEDVGKGLKATGDEIEKFGKKISPK